MVTQVSPLLLENIFILTTCLGYIRIWYWYYNPKNRFSCIERMFLSEKSEYVNYINTKYFKALCESYKASAQVGKVTTRSSYLFLNCFFYQRDNNQEGYPWWSIISLTLKNVQHSLCSCFKFKINCYKSLKDFCIFIMSKNGHLNLSFLTINNDVWATTTKIIVKIS